MTQTLPQLPRLECLRCGWSWVPRRNRLPRVCPKCNSPYWNKPRQKIRKKGGKATPRP